MGLGHCHRQVGEGETRLGKGLHGLRRDEEMELLVLGFSYLLCPMFLSPVLATGPTLSMGLPVTVDVSGTSNSAPVGHGNIQKPLGRYF